jgi:hypothetical protein
MVVGLVVGAKTFTLAFKLLEFSGEIGLLLLETSLNDLGSGEQPFFKGSECFIFYCDGSFLL